MHQSCLFVCSSKVAVKTSGMWCEGTEQVERGHTKCWLTVFSLITSSSINSYWIIFLHNPVFQSFLPLFLYKQYFKSAEALYHPGTKPKGIFELFKRQVQIYPLHFPNECPWSYSIFINEVYFYKTIRLFPVMHTWQWISMDKTKSHNTFQLNRSHAVYLAKLCFDWRNQSSIQHSS